MPYPLGHTAAYVSCHQFKFCFSPTPTHVAIICKLRRPFLLGKATCSALKESDKNNEILETKDVENNAEEKGSLKEDEEIGRIDENISRPPPPTPRTESILNTTHCNEIQDSDNSLEIKAENVENIPSASYCTKKLT